MGVGDQHLAPAALPPGKTRYPLYRRLGGPQGRSGRVRKISPPPEFDPQTVKPVASRYIDWAIPAHGGTPVQDASKAKYIKCILLVLLRNGYVLFDAEIRCTLTITVW